MDLFFDSTKENLAYTLGIIKPDTAVKRKNIQDIIEVIEQEGFIIKNILQRELVREEIINIFYKHVNKPYFDEILNYLLNGESCVFLLCHETEDPIKKWKKIIGNSDPIEAKKVDPSSLRAKYGFDKIRNEFHGSDNPAEANKERDIFKFPIPQKTPDFYYDKFKITLEYLMKFLFPQNLEHPNINQRLDLFAVYGPIVNHHSIDQCFCKDCTPFIKDNLDQTMMDKFIKEKTKLVIFFFILKILIQKKGLSTRNEIAKTFSSSTRMEEKVKINPIRLINEEGVQRVYTNLCEKCKHHCESYTHLCGGRDAQHVLTDAEIKLLGLEMNRKDILELLTIEKGNAAKMMIEQISLDEPKSIILEREHIEIMFSDLKTDYYNRFDFIDLQQVILEDRRIRLTYWISSIIDKPIDRFVNPKLVDHTVSEKERRNIKSVNFTLNRKLPLSLTCKKQQINYTPVEFPHSIVDKQKLSANEEKIVILKKLHRESHHLAEIHEVNKPHFVTSVILLRNYNEGRNGGWNNYCCLKGNSKESYVKKSKEEINI